MVVGGRYEIGEKLGAGTVGTVHVAHDVRIGRRVAIKLVRRPPQSDTEAGEAYERLRVEAQAAGGLSHPNIVTIHDFGEDDDLSWIVMGLVEGESLRGLLDRGVRLPIPDVARIMTELLAALAFSHDHGVVQVFAVEGHDLKPVARASIGRWAEGLAWSRDGKTILVQNDRDRTISVFTFDGHALTAQPDLIPTGGPVAFGTAWP